MNALVPVPSIDWTAEPYASALKRAADEGYREGHAAGAERASILILQARREALIEASDRLLMALNVAAQELRREGQVS